MAQVSNGRELIIDWFLIHLFTLARCISAAKVVVVIIYMYIANTDSSQCPKFCNTFFPLEKLSCVKQECDLRKHKARWIGKLSTWYHRTGYFCGSIIIVNIANGL